MDSEWKSALEKSLIDAANFPLPMEVFKVRRRFIAVFLLFSRINCVKSCPHQIISHYLKSYLLGRRSFIMFKMLSVPFCSAL